MTSPLTSYAAPFARDPMRRLLDVLTAGVHREVQVVSQSRLDSGLLPQVGVPASDRALDGAKPEPMKNPECSWETGHAWSCPGRHGLDDNLPEEWKTT